MLPQDMRPASLADVMGNSAAVSSLTTMLRSDSRPHSFLFTGPSGCGKTTLARILATELKCAPICCQEIDGATYTGIDDMRDVMQSLSYAPVEGECRVIIIDECHMLSKNAQNAILKSLEDVPRHTYWMLCSTDPDKLLPTVRNRCAQYEVSPLSDDDMFSLLDRASQHLKLGSKFADTNEAANELMADIVVIAKGCPRHALQMFETVAQLADLKEARKVLRDMDVEGQVYDVCKLIARGQKWGQIQPTVAKLKLDSSGAEKGRRLCLSFFKSCLLSPKNTANADRYARLIQVFAPDVFASGEAGFIAMLWQATQV